MTRTRIAPRTYQDAQLRYWARFPVHGRYTWKLLKDVTTKREAIAAAQSATSARADDFAALAKLYEAAGCPNRRLEVRPAAFLAAERIRLKSVVSWFGKFTPEEIRLPLLPQYADWRMRQVTRTGNGQRTVDLDFVTLSNVLQYGIACGVIEMNYIRANRPRYRRAADVRHATHTMPESADAIHKVCEVLLDNIRSEVMAWITLFQMFTGCRTSELLRLRLDAAPQVAGHIAAGFLHLGRRSKSGVNPFCAIGPEFAAMIACFDRWHAARHPRAKVYFPGPMGTVIDSGSHGHALVRAAKELGLPHITPHGLRSYYVTKRRRDKAMDSQIAAEIGDKTVDLISKVYGDAPGGAVLSWTPATTLPAWLRWQPDAAKIERIA